MMRHETFNVSGPARIEANNSAGLVEIHAGDSDSASVVVTIDGPAADEWEIVQVGDSVSIRRSRERGWRSRSTRVHVEAPPGSDLEIATASADVATVGEFGAAAIRTASGAVRIDSLDRLEAKTASGDVRAGKVASGATCTTASGDVEIGLVGGRMEVSTASGDVRVGDVDGAVEVGTASGDVAVGCCSGADVSAKCLSGNVTIGLPEGIRVEPDISTMSGRTSLPEPSSTPQSDRPRRSVRVRLRTMSGDIAINRVVDDAG